MVKITIDVILFKFSYAFTNYLPNKAICLNKSLVIIVYFKNQCEQYTLPRFIARTHGPLNWREQTKRNHQKDSKHTLTYTQLDITNYKTELMSQKLFLKHLTHVFCMSMQNKSFSSAIFSFLHFSLRAFLFQIWRTNLLSQKLFLNNCHMIFAWVWETNFLFVHFLFSPFLSQCTFLEHMLMITEKIHEETNFAHQFNVIKTVLHTTVTWLLHEYVK